MVIIAYGSNKTPSVIHLESPIDFSKIKEVPMAKEKEESFGAAMEEFADVLCKFLSFCFDDESEKKEPSKKSNASAPRKIKIECDEQKVIRKKTGQIASELSVNPKNVSRLIKRFNTISTGGKISLPQKIGDGYSASECVWNIFKNTIDFDA